MTDSLGLKTIGNPGEMVCSIVKPASSSACCWASAPAKVTGAVAPAIGAGSTFVGNSRFADWVKADELPLSKLSGLIGDTEVAKLG